ncbi:MAG: integrase arm-type DNA-binding domain-containing protein [Blastomonas fulva]|uniref:tyrosine-type recombinase/integrase n=1 Tax=Blastomonas fulva TaxID=1550728 RepID=UPI0024E26141|nr:integrase arm-type DNA-binding domain-containing protein [Blastomonas fulva]MDK2758785.1 integrase arm-type DNA-binding domain-containing protein [Blastomonas fulva]
MLTNAAAKAAQPLSRAHKLYDSGGLFLLVTPAGTKSWRLKYRRAGREQLKTLGRFPDVNLAQARTLRDQAKQDLARGVDQLEQLRSFADIARAWHAHNLARWSPVHADDVIAGLERDVFPAIGAMPIGDIRPSELLQLIRRVEARGCRATASRLRQRLSAVFGFAIAQDLVAADPAAQLGRAMTGTGLVQPHPALIDIAECRALLHACEFARANLHVRLASRFLALTAVRLDAVRGMRWGEIEWSCMDTGRPAWRVPPARMKLARAKKGEARFAHLVPLSAPALAVLVAAAEIQGQRDGMSIDPEHLVFAARGGAAPIGRGSIGALIARAGYQGRHVPHGWRSSFSTILNDDLGPDFRAAIDRALAHSPKDKVEAAYNRSGMIDQRTAIFNRWGELLAG